MIQLQLGQSRGDRRLEPALVCAALDLEKAAVAPIGPPRVGDGPVVDAAVGPPADDLHRVAALGEELERLLRADQLGAPGF